MTFHPRTSFGSFKHWGAAAALGGFFIISGCLKILDFGRFVSAVQDFQILPDWMSISASTLIVTMEIAGGGLLLLGRNVKMAAIGLSALTMLFSVAIAINLLREHIVPCGCFGFVAEGRISIWYLLRNFCIIILLLLCSGITKKSSSER